MKTITITLIFLLYVVGMFAQQQVNFVNSSGYDIFISYIVTTTNTDISGDGSPQLMSADGGIVVPSGMSYSAFETPQNNTFSFPYNDFNGIDQWYVSGSISPILSNQAYEDYGEHQKFYFAKVTVVGGNFADGDNIGQNFGDSQSYIYGSNVSFYFSELRPNPADPSWVIYNILAL